MSDFEWCTDCKEYDHNKHCCPRWTKVIRTTLNDNINAVLDEIKEEFISLYPKNYAGEPELGGLSCVFSLDKVFEIIDKYKEGVSE